MGIYNPIVTASRNVSASDFEKVIQTTGAANITLTVPDDASLGGNGTSMVVGFFNGGSGTLSVVAGPNVTFRGLTPAFAAYSTQGLMRVGANEWTWL